MCLSVSQDVFTQVVLLYVNNSFSHRRMGDVNRPHGVTALLLSSVVCFSVKDSRVIRIVPLLRNGQPLKEKSVLTEKKSNSQPSCRGGVKNECR